MESKLITRSKKLICKGLTEEMLRRNQYNDISIKEISFNCGVSTRTIYRHFKSVDDILYHSIKYMIADYKAGTEKPVNLDLQYELTSLCTFFEGNKDFFQSLHRNSKFGTFRRALTEIGALGFYIFNPEDKENSYNNVYYSKYFQKFIISMLSDLMEVWVVNEFKETPKELAFIAMYFVKSVSEVNKINK